MVETVFDDNKNKPEKNKPMSFEQACNYLDSLKALDLKTEAKKINVPINVETVEDMRRFLGYAISLIDRKKYPAQRKLLEVRVMGMPIDDIAKSFNVKREIVIRLEKEAILIAMEAINKTRETQLPILGSLN